MWTAERSGILRAVGPRWGLRQALIGYAVAFLCSGLAVVFAWTIDADGILVTIAGSIGLWIGFIGAPVYASRQHGSGRLRYDFGLRIHWIDVPIGLLAGTLAQLVVLPLVYLPLRLIFGSWDVNASGRTLTEAAHRWEVVALVLVVAVGAPIVEELFFRGLLLCSLRRRWTTTVAVLATSVVFAGTHFQPRQLISLFVAGTVFAGLTVATGRLGPAIWAHAAFNATTVFLLTMR